MAKWKPVGGETWRKRKRRYPVSGTVWWMPGKTYRAPVGPDALYDSVIISPPSTGKNDAQP